MLYVLCGIAAAIVLFLIVVALRPSDFRVERNATMNAPAERVFAQVNDFHNWPAWSPWEKFDPNMKRTFEGPSSGVGAKYGWIGNKKVGEGRMTIIDSNAPSSIRIKLEFLRPFAATNSVEFVFTPQAGQTNVVWSMASKKKFMMKMFTMFMNLDKMVGGDFERGLANMKAIVESSASK